MDRIAKLCRIYVRWNKRELTENEAMMQIRKLFKDEFHKAWLKDQGMEA